MLLQNNENPSLFLKLYSKYEPLVRAYVRNGLHNHDESF